MDEEEDGNYDDLMTGVGSKKSLLDLEGEGKGRGRGKKLPERGRMTP